MEGKKLFGMLTLIVGVILFFSLIGCSDNNDGSGLGTPLESSQIWSQLRDTTWIKEGAIDNLPSIVFYSAYSGPHPSPSSVEGNAYFGILSPSGYSSMYTNHRLYVDGSKITDQNGRSLFNVVVSGNTLTISNWNHDDNVPSAIINGTYIKDEN